MSFEVKAVDGNVEEKSKAQVEETLLKNMKNNLKIRQINLLMTELIV